MWKYSLFMAIVGVWVAVLAWKIVLLLVLATPLLLAMFEQGRRLSRPVPAVAVARRDWFDDLGPRPYN